MHEAIDLLSRALGRAGRPPIGSSDFQTAAADCGFWSFFGAQVDEWNARNAEHPRAGPGFVIRTPPRELANRAVRLFRDQYRSGGQRSIGGQTRSVIEPASLLTQLKRMGTLSEVRLEHPSLPLAGILDLIAWEDDAASIVDFKTGQPKDNHRDQLLLYALLWWRVTGAPPARVELQYLDDVWSAPIALNELERVELQVGDSIRSAVAALGARPAPARTGAECDRCPVRARCDEGWPVAARRSGVSGHATDCELTVAATPTPTGFTGLGADGREIPVVFDFAVGRTLPPLQAGVRVRLVDVLPHGEGKALEVRAWSECYLMGAT